METVRLVFFIIAIVVASFIVFFIGFDIVCVSIFNTIFKKHNKAMAVVLNVKLDNLMNLYDLMKNSDIVIPEQVSSMVCTIQRNDLNNPDTKESKNAQEKLTYILDELLFISRTENSLVSNDEFQLVKENIKQLDFQYRNTVAMYNADCLGYNYWISFWPTRWVWKMLKFEKKELINL